MRRFYALIIILFISTTFYGQTGSKLNAKVYAAGENQTLTVQTATYFDVSEPLKDMKPSEEIEGEGWEDGIVKNGFRYKFGNGPKTPVDDPTWQKQEGSKSVMAPIVNVDGAQNSDNSGLVAPPDTQGDVGPNHYVQMVNNVTEIFNKSGTSIWGPQPSSIFWSGFIGSWTGTNDGDTVVLYDQQADRWLVSQFAVNTTDNTQWELIAISQTGDPTGSYYRYAFQFNDMPDYPKLGIWPDGYYLSANRFTVSGGSFNGTYAAAMERSAMLVGNATAQMILFSNNSSSDPYSMLPSDCDGAFPTTGTPNYFCYDTDDNTYWTADRIKVWAFNTDWTTPSNSSFTQVSSLIPASFNSSFSSSAAIDQPGSQGLDALGDRMMFRAQYRKFTSHQSIVLCRPVNLGSDHAGMRWYELRNTGSGWSIYQQGTYGPDALSRWMGSIAMNGSGDIALGYSVAGSATNPSIRYTGRLAGDALGLMTIAESSILAGTAAQSGVNRWGDYSMMSVDPTDDNTFWYTTEYSSGSWYWKTRIASFQFAPATLPPTAAFSASNTLPLNTSTIVNFTDLSTGSPSSWLWTFSPSTVTYTSGSSTSQNPSVKFNNTGAYTVLLTVSNAYGNDSEVKSAYIHVGQPGLWTGPASNTWSFATNWENQIVPNATTDVTISSSAINWPDYTGNFNVGSVCSNLILQNGAEMTVNGNFTINSGKTLTMSGTSTLKISGDWINNGTFNSGSGNVEFIGSSPSVINSPPSGPVYLINDGFSTWPGNLNGNLGTGNGQFSQQSTSNAGGTSPEARFLWQNITSTRRMYFDPVNTSGLSSLTLDFRHMIDHYQNTGTYTVKVQYSTNGTTWNDAGWSLSPGANVNATQVSLNLTGAQGVGASNYYIGFTITGNLFNIDYWYIDNVQLYYSVSGGLNFYNLTINKTLNTATVNGNLNVNNDLTLKPNAYFTNTTGSALNVGGNFLLESSSTSTASFIDDGTTNVSGSTVVEKYYTDNRWHFISSPTTATQSGAFLDIYFKEWDESTYTWNYITPTNYPLVPGTGYEIWSTLGNPTVNYNGGNLNANSYSPALSATDVNGGGIGANEGWNMIGNAFPSAIDLGNSSNPYPGYSRSGLDNSVYFWNGAQYSSYNPGTNTSINGGTRYVPSMQGFFVKAGATSPSLTIPATAKVHNSQTNYKSKSELPALKLKVEGNNYSDEMMVMENPASTVGFDPDFDAWKIWGIQEAPQLFAMISDMNLSVNTLPEIVDETVVEIGLKVTIDNEYTIHLEDLQYFDEFDFILLEDLKTGNVVNLKNTPDYSFAATSDDDPHRFNLRFQSDWVGIEEDNNQSVHIYSFGDKVYLQKPVSLKGSLTLFDISGKKVIQENVSDNSSIFRLKITNNSGYFLVKFVSTEFMLSEKVFIR